MTQLKHSEWQQTTAFLLILPEHYTRVPARDDLSTILGNLPSKNNLTT